MSNARETILSRVRESIGMNCHIPDSAPHFNGAIKLEFDGDLYQNFKVNQENNKAVVIETERENLTQTLNTILQENESKDVLYNPDIDMDCAQLEGCNFIPYTQVVDTFREKLFQIDTSIVQARCGVADLGIIVLTSNPNAPRLSSLVTNTCIYLLDKRNIVQHIYAGIEFAKKYERERSGTDILPSNIVIVAGPSRTADIELQTVFGVHGPRKTYVVLY